ncbi:MAG: PEP-CTERM sorting domain-containing protein [Verrucomicrobiales bacterium]|jgi:hypothetical protein|nr:PEP-CTERM sorting domain-containing protein [Verrucomicrobiales bacterium]
MVIPAMTALTVSGMAQVLVNDSFSNAIVEGSGTDSKVTSNSGSEYISIYGTGNSPAVYNASASFGNNTMQVIGDGGIVYRAVDFSPYTSDGIFTLNSLSTGQTISISLSVAFGNNPDGKLTDGNTEFDFGFIRYNDPSTTRPANDDPADNTSVLYVRQDTAKKTNATKIDYRTGFVHMGGGTNLKSITDVVLNAATAYTLTLNVTKNDLGTFDITYLRDDVSVSVFPDFTHALTATKDLEITGIGFRFPAATNFSALIDNVTVSIIPEPSAVALLGLGAVVLLALLWQRRTQNIGG